MTKSILPGRMKKALASLNPFGPTEEEVMAEFRDLMMKDPERFGDYLDTCRYPLKFSYVKLYTKMFQLAATYPVSGLKVMRALNERGFLDCVEITMLEVADMVAAGHPPESFELLRSRAIQLESLDYNALADAAHECKTELVRYFLDAGLNPNGPLIRNALAQVGEDGKINQVTEAEMIETAFILVDAGADVSVLDRLNDEGHAIVKRALVARAIEFQGDAEGTAPNMQRPRI